MESLYLLIPLSAGLVLLILAVFAWGLYRGQFEDLEGEGERILQHDPPALDNDQGPQRAGPEESRHSIGVPLPGLKP